MEFKDKFNNESTEELANNWTPETGFHSKKLMNNRDSYPRPGLGKELN